MSDLAELNLRVRAEQVTQAKRELEGLSTAGKGAEASQKGVTAASEKQSDTVGKLNRTMVMLVKELQLLTSATTQAKGTTAALTKAEEDQVQAAKKLGQATDGLSQEVKELLNAETMVAKAQRDSTRAGVAQAAGLANLDQKTGRVVQEVKELADANKTAASTSKKLTKASKDQGNVFAKLDAATGGLSSKVLALASAYGAFQVALGIGAQLVSFERGLVGVGKTADISGQRLSNLGDAIADLSLDLGNKSADGLLELGETAGQLGVTGRQNILAFIETLAKLESASDLGGSEGATTLARLLSVSGEQAQEVGRLGSVLVALGNTSAATEKEISLTALSVAQGTNAYGLASTEAAGLGATYAQLGVQVQLAGSVTGRALGVIEAATRKGGAEMEVLTRITGLTREEFKGLLEDSPADAFGALIKGISDTAAAGGSTIAVMEELGLTGEELNKVIPTLSNNYGVLAEKLQTARDEAASGNALTKEAATAADTMGGALGRLRNTLTAVVLSLRGVTGPITDVINGITHLIQLLFGLGDAYEKASPATRTLVDVTRALTAAAGGFAAVKLVTYVGSLAGSFRSAAIAAKALAIAMASNPIGLAVAATAALIAGLTILSRKTLTIGDDVVTYGDIAVAVLENITQRAILGGEIVVLLVTKLLRALGIDVQNFGSSLWEFISGFGKNLLSLFQNDVFGGIVLASKFVVNSIIALVVSATQTLGVLAGRAIAIVSSISDINVFDLSSFGRVRDQISAALDPEDTIAEVGAKWKKNFDNDFVKEFVGTIKTGASEIKTTLERAVLDLIDGDADFEEVYRKFQELGGVDLAAVLENVSRNAVGRARERAAAFAEEAAEAEQLADTVATVATEVEELNDVDLSGLDEGLQQARNSLKGMALDLAQAKADLEFTIASFVSGASDSQIAREIELQRFSREVTQLLAEAGFREADGSLDEEGKKRLQNLIDQKNAVEDLTEKERALRQLRQEEEEELERQQQREKERAQEIGNAFGEAAGAIVSGAQNAEDALVDLAVQLAIVAATAAVENFLPQGVGQSGLTGALSGFGAAFANSRQNNRSSRNAMGAVVDEGRIQRFAMGGVLMSPTTTIMPDGSSAQIAEGGRPEAIMPLQRLANGDLGVQMTGTPNGGSTVHQRVTQRITITAPDADSFRKSRAQISEELRRPMTRGA